MSSRNGCRRGAAISKAHVHAEVVVLLPNSSSVTVDRLRAARKALMTSSWPAQRSHPAFNAGVGSILARGAIAVQVGAGADRIRRRGVCHENSAGLHAERQLHDTGQREPMPHVIQRRAAVHLDAGVRPLGVLNRIYAVRCDFEYE